MASSLHSARSERREVDLHGHAVLDSGAIINLRVTNLSYDGCKIECGAELRKGTGLKLSVLRRGVIDAEVRWTAGNTAGLAFSSSETPGPWTRKSERVAVTATVWLRRLGQIPYSVHVFDASPDGCQVDLVQMPKLEEHVWIRFPGLEAVEAQVCWIGGQKAGVRYIRPLHPAVFQLLLARLDAQPAGPT